MIYALIIGLIVGAIAKFLMPGKDPGGIFVTMLIGIAGAATAHFLGVQMGIYQEGEGAGFLASVLGSMILLFLYRLLTRKRGI